MDITGFVVIGISMVDVCTLGLGLLAMSRGVYGRWADSWDWFYLV